MANALYGNFKLVQLGGTVTGVVAADLNDDDIQAMLLDSDYVPDLNAHVDLDDVPAGAEMSTGGTADMGTTTLGLSSGVVTFDAPDTTFTSVTNGTAANYVLIFNNTGATDANRLLIVLFDTGTGLPVTPNGGNIVVQYHANGIFTW